MADFRFPNESDEYRKRRNELLDAEIALRAQTEAVAQKRRELPLGGRLKEDYSFERLDADGQLRQVPFADLFGDHDTLLLYSYMFGPQWDAPCPSCTSIADALSANYVSVADTCSLAVVSHADPQQLREWATRRGWSDMPVVSGGKTSYLRDYAGFEATDPAMVSIMNVFRRTPDGIFHSWGTELVSNPMDNGHPRHVDTVWPLWNLLDMTPQGRGTHKANKQDYEHVYFSKHCLGEE